MLISKFPLTDATADILRADSLPIYLVTLSNEYHPRFRVSR